ncbi:hypothetical protein H1D32_16390 [Anaerobacillus sp. CMMVII]|uniref:hypothetical protein n=1 Tax=Anaerobacillus sp. CMMVII TaxID=2755588 RepID=UPI0021B7E6C3|nr:hypothetical protein [Anaerobacillus sp. CMMVII]MCT8139144.1 hypothetical protein [Anaerobacillus sp. CMMVII]
MKAEVLKTIQLVTKIIGSLSESQLEKLLNGEAKLVFSEREVVQKVEKKQVASNHPVFEQLREFNNREEATKLLSQKSILKKDLIEIASTFKVHINKNDTKAKLVEKIVEATVGVALRSQAIKETAVNR